MVGSAGPPKVSPSSSEYPLIGAQSSKLPSMVISAKKAFAVLKLDNKTNDIITTIILIAITSFRSIRIIGFANFVIAPQITNMIHYNPVEYFFSYSQPSFIFHPSSFLSTPAYLQV